MADSDFSDCDSASDEEMDAMPDYSSEESGSYGDEEEQIQDLYTFRANDQSSSSDDSESESVAAVAGIDAMDTSTDAVPPISPDIDAANFTRCNENNHTTHTEYEFSNEGKEGPTDATKDLRSPLDIFLFFFNESFWSDTAKESTRYVPQLILSVFIHIL